MPRLAWVTVVAGWCALVHGAGGVARADTRASADISATAKRPALPLSTEVQRCLRVGQLPRWDREDAQLQCLSNQDESGFVELVRSIAKRRYEDPGFGAERLEHLSWKLRAAISKGQEAAAVAVEIMLDDAPSYDVELQTTALEAMRWVTIARRTADGAKGKKKDAGRPLVTAPKACAERVDDADARVARKAVACVAEAETGIPTERLIDAALQHPERVDIWRLLKRLRRLPEPLARRLAEALVAKRSNDDHRADDFCETLLNTTPNDAAWATLAGRRAFELFDVRECGELARRSHPREPAYRSDLAAEPQPIRSRCLDVPTVLNQYVAVCADDLGPAAHDPSQRAKLQVRRSRFSRYDPGPVLTTHPWLLEGERLLVDELNYVVLTEPPRQNGRWQAWDEGLVIVPSSREDGSGRRLHVFSRRNVGLTPLWQSPECSQTSCRLDLVVRRKIEDGKLLGLLLLGNGPAQPVAVSELLQGTLDERLGCSRLRPLALSDCRGLGAR